jgi:hypothetical protein
MYERAPDARRASVPIIFVDENHWSMVGTTQEDANTMFASVNQFPTPATGWPEKWKEDRNHGCRRLFGDFLAAQKVTQPVEAVDHNFGHTFFKNINKEDFANGINISVDSTARSPIISSLK